ncbi:hypothetical protein [Nonomuraea sp. NPDC050691]|uniref:hypothetical protein n=1 Tax=Nonomuraea sp. NPDC050691 TaxID=3155661 RepID=UPI0033FC77CD
MLVVRKALYFGLLAALGATFGWFSWIAAGILLAKTREVWISALVGGLLGVVIDALVRYRRTMRAKQEDEPVIGFPVLTVLLSASGTFLAAAGENALGELIKEVRWPFLFSVTTFFVGGLAVLALTELLRFLGKGLDEDTAEDEVVPMLMLKGFLLVLGSLLMAAPVSLANLLAGSDAAYPSLASWWMLIGIVAGVAVLTARHSPWFAIVASAITLGVIAVFFALVGLGPTEELERTVPVSAPKFGSLIAGITQGLLEVPDVPAQTWTAAQAQLRAGASGELIEPEIPPFVSGPLSFIAGCDRMPAQPSVFAPDTYLTRKHALCGKIEATTNAEWTRSLIVVGFFCAALVWATRLERRWRPEDYERHPIRGYDRALLGLALLGLLAGLLTLRSGGY